METIFFSVCVFLWLCHWKDLLKILTVCDYIIRAFEENRLGEWTQKQKIVFFLPKSYGPALDHPPLPTRFYVAPKYNLKLLLREVVK